MLSVLDLFKIGLGPSSSHTMGPMNAARLFVTDLEARGLLTRTRRLTTELFGSLALTGQGHCTDRAILLGLEGHRPDAIEAREIEPILERIRANQRLALLGWHQIAFDEPADLCFHRTQSLPAHPNGIRFAAHNKTGSVIHEDTFYSVGGGFVVRAAELERPTNDAAPLKVRYPFESGAELLQRAREYGLAIHELVRANELTWRSEDETTEALFTIWQVMEACIERGLNTPGVLPGVLKVERRAPALHRRLRESATTHALKALDWISAFAIAVNEENAAGGRVVTAPTNGAAGIVPAVLAYYRRFERDSEEAGIVRFLLTAGAIGYLYKRNASISGAEMGCQGEVGVACSMAAAGLVSALGGTNEQIENAAEIGMEHNLGLTCDPVAGLVQIPCIERNAMGAIKAVNAARLAMHGDGRHKVSLDQVIATMRQTGRDMWTIYKETSQGGLAVNVPEC